MKFQKKKRNRKEEKSAPQGFVGGKTSLRDLTAPPDESLISELVSTGCCACCPKQETKVFTSTRRHQNGKAYLSWIQYMLAVEFESELDLTRGALNPTISQPQYMLQTLNLKWIQ